MQAALTAAALTIVAVVLALTGLELAHLYDTTVAICAAHHDCSAATTNFTAADGPLQVFSDFLLLVVPLLIGMFWGAPLISREFEAGTFRLAWTQGVTRSRWLAVKLGLGAVASAAIAGLLSLIVSWWSSQLDQVNANPFDSLRFGVRDIDAWVYSAQIVDRAGHTPTTSFLSRACPLGNYGPLNPRDCTARLAATFHQLVTYQPGSRYWPMQWSELAIFLGLSIVLGGLCFWWIRRPVI
jgi:hypothetical protein